MSDRVKELRSELNALYEYFATGDEGLTLTRATKEDHESVAKWVAEMPLDQMTQEVAIVAAQEVSDLILSKGLRPADYWRDQQLADELAKRLAKAMVESKIFGPAFLEILRGQG